MICHALSYRMNFAVLCMCLTVKLSTFMFCYHCCSALSALCHLSLLAANQLWHEHGVRSRTRNCSGTVKDCDSVNLRQKTQKEQMKDGWRTMYITITADYTHLIKMPKAPSATDCFCWGVIITDAYYNFNCNMCSIQKSTILRELAKGSTSNNCL